MIKKHHKIDRSKNIFSAKKNKGNYFFPLLVILTSSIYMGFNLASKTAQAEEIMVYKSPTCGCCNKWVSHLENQGFDVKTKNMRDVRLIKDEFGVQQKFQSCHTAKIGKYFIEGHVSAKDIKRLLKEKPDIKGLSVPGMPMGSPGMEGHRKDKYDVIAIDKNNNTRIYSKH